METIPTNTEQLKALLLRLIEHQESLEEDANLPDLQCAMTSMLFAREALEKVWAGNAPEEYLRRYIQILENRYHRLMDEDSGEFGSGRDSLGALLFALEQLLLSAGMAA